MNSRRKFMQRQLPDRLKVAADLLEQITPDGLKVLADCFDNPLAKRELLHWAELIQDLRATNVDTRPAWTPFVETAHSDDLTEHLRLCKIMNVDRVFRNSRYEVSARTLEPTLVGRCEFCRAEEVCLPGAVKSDPDQRVCAACLDDPNTGAVSQAIVHLSIKNVVDRGPTHDWRDLQRIKNELIGPDREGIELYPAESRLVDTSNQFHIFVLPEGMQMPFGYGSRLVVETEDFGVRQRPFEDADVKAEAAENYRKLLAGEIQGSDALLATHPGAAGRLASEKLQAV